MESGCRDGFIDPESCRKFLPEKLYSRWGNASCEAAFPDSVKLYCPFKDCSALLIYDEGDEEMKTVAYNVCSHCSREFCVTSRVAWHSGITCEDHWEVAEKDGDEAVLKMAEKFRWRRCPRCSFLVEKISGCSHVECRCGCYFCYECGFDKLKEIPHHWCDQTRARITFPNHRNPYQFPRMVSAQVIASLNYQVPTEVQHNDDVIIYRAYPLGPPQDPHYRVTSPNYRLYRYG
ncbi:hypothetical protein J5N97_009307 [Dioscorea zingiberensis]|uniref:RBR-type E3 ubiquitin transferase n=1 Tax=Dioscorea zingiberensis TaxID=325984 RepID=A0A9D5CXZ9_9LILI|nr:hypothetical protein J5N97_009307 [Dioscorea zingiberensis]